MALSKAAWVKQVLGVDPEAEGQLQTADAQQPAMAEAQEDAPQGNGANAQTPATAPDAAANDAPGAIPVIPIVIAGAKLLLGELTAKVTIVNATSDVTMTLDGASIKLKDGEYKSGRPAATLKPGEHTEFTVHSTPVVDIPIPLLNSLIPNVNHCEGTIRYSCGDPKTVASCFFINPRNITDPLGTNDAKGNVTGPGAAVLKLDAKKTHGSDGTFDFTLTGGGNGPGPQPNNGGGVAASCRVSVVNDTGQTIFLRKQDKAAGDYVTNPDKSVAPGKKTDFVFAETPNGNDHGCRGLMTWEVGDPKQAKWELMWENPKGAKNITASFLDNAAFHTLDQIDQGDENVPVTFTLSGSGQGPTPEPVSKATSSVITVCNHTDVVLKLQKATAHTGAFTTPPPATIAPTEYAEIEFAGPEDPNQNERGAMDWLVGEGDGASTWHMEWLNPRGSDNEASSALDTALNGVSTESDAGSGDQDVDFIFTLTGFAEPQPQPQQGGEPTSCAIMVTNDTKSVLTLAGTDPKQGAFGKAPPKTLAPGASALVTFKGPKDAPATGAVGSMTWDVGSPKVTSWKLDWENPPGNPNTVTDRLDPTVDGITSTSSVEAGDDDVPFTFTISGDGAAPATKTTCEIAIFNDTQLPMKLVSQDAASGSFSKAPPNQIDPGKSGAAKFEGAKNDPKGAAGSVKYQLGDDANATCSMTWLNPPGAGNQAQIELQPDGQGFATDASAGDGDEDVPFIYGIKGGAGPQPQDKDDEFVVPPKGKQPTLRKGDKSPDGWVEYAQELLNKYGKSNLTIDGDFGNGTFTAVKKFQKDNGCLDDGVIGNETWSVLRKGQKEPVGTDGRTPHSFEEKGAQARFPVENEDALRYIEKDDRLGILVVSTGEQPIETNKVTLKVTQPDGTSHVHAVPIGKIDRPSPDGQGSVSQVDFPNFKALFKLKPGVKPTDCTLDAYLDAEIGGDRWTGPLHT